MSQRLKRWESPRHEGRNAKGRGGSARQRQLLKRQQQLRKRLKANAQDAKSPDDSNSNTFGHSPGKTHRPNPHKKGETAMSPLFYGLFYDWLQSRYWGAWLGFAIAAG